MTRTGYQRSAGRSVDEINGAESGGVIQRSKVTFELTLTTPTTVFVEKHPNVHLAPLLQALGPSIGYHPEHNMERRMFEYLF